MILAYLRAVVLVNAYMPGAPVKFVPLVNGYGYSDKTESENHGEAVKRVLIFFICN